MVNVDVEMPRKLRATKWKASTDPLFRGDGKIMAVPNPRAPDAIVRHILYLDGPGRQTPFLSTCESEEVARRFAGYGGRVWSTWVQTCRAEAVGHRSNAELMNLLQGKGKGDAVWRSAQEVQQARAYVELWGEHLLDFRAHRGKKGSELKFLLAILFEGKKP